MSAELLHSTGTNGLVAYDVDLTKPPTGGGAGMITAGSTWNFQFWYRDPTGPATFNSSDATSLTFLP